MLCHLHFHIFLLSFNVNTSHVVYALMHGSYSLSTCTPFPSITKLHVYKIHQQKKENTHTVLKIYFSK